jgi:DNA-binding transcriptional ArsR family regulator
MSPPTPPDPELNEVTDARVMRALSHPVRISLLDALALEPQLTATEAAERLGESPTTCSFHLRQLAKYGFVEEVGGGKGRARPWRRTSDGMRFSSDHDDPETAVAAGALERLFRERGLRRLQGWYETRGSYSRAWREASTASQFDHWMTPEELTELNEEIIALISTRFPERRDDPGVRPDGALPVEHLVFAYPMSLTNGGLE